MRRKSIPALTIVKVPVSALGDYQRSFDEDVMSCFGANHKQTLALMHEPQYAIDFVSWIFAFAVHRADRTMVEVPDLLRTELERLVDTKDVEMAIKIQSKRIVSRTVVNGVNQLLEVHPQIATERSSAWW